MPMLRLALVALFTIPTLLQPGRARNPVIEGWYADPEAHVFEGKYWIFPTYSAPYDQQTFMDAFSSSDLVTWTKHTRILDVKDVAWAKRALWAPSIVEKNGWYYLFFGANDIQNDQEIGGIGVARAKTPAGPFIDYLGHPLIDKFHNGAQPIDQFVFRDRDGSYYIVYGGWRHCNIARLNDDFTGLVPFADGTTFKEITPQGYVEGAFMLQKDGKYYFMWSEGGWTGPNYAVAYAVGTSPFGPFERVGKILQQDPSVATGAGHHSVLHAVGSDKWYIVYHRRPLGDTDRNHRVVCIDELTFDGKGMIVPVRITAEGVAADPLPPAGRVDELSVPDKKAGAERKIWLYTPPGYDPSAPPYPVAYLFDGDDYAHVLELPAILDRLIAERKVPPIVAVMIDNAADRLGDLANRTSFADYMSKTVVPWAHKQVTITNDPQRTIVGGYSAGGLGAAYVAFYRPDLFGLVLSQSGAFWRGNEGRSSPYNWLASEVEASPRRAVYFYVEVGADETAQVLGSGPRFIDATRVFRAALEKRGYALTYVEVPNAKHDSDHWRAQLPAALIALASRLRPGR